MCVVVVCDVWAGEWKNGKGKWRNCLRGRGEWITTNHCRNLKLNFDFLYCITGNIFLWRVENEKLFVYSVHAVCMLTVN